MDKKSTEVAVIAEDNTAENNEFIRRVKIKKPIELDGKEINVIVLDFSELSGDDMLKIDREMRREGSPTGFENVWSMDAMLKLSARASGIIEDDLRRLHGLDFTEVVLVTRQFFIQW